MRIASYNVNGIRAAVRKGMAEWFAAHPVDLLCLQETKAQPNQAGKEQAKLKEAGLPYAYWHSAEKKGYSGVATFSRQPADLVVEGCGIDKYDREGRILRTDFGALTVLNCYFPSGTTGAVRQDFKMAFLDDFLEWVHQLREERPNLVILGDYNIAHNEIDIHDPVRNKKNSGFLPEERAWMDQWFESGFTDAFRHLNPEEVSYSWWTYRTNARANNKGWRLDYQSVSAPLVPQLSAARQLPEAAHSDHCPVYIEIQEVPGQG